MASYPMPTTPKKATSSELGEESAVVPKVAQTVQDHPDGPSICDDEIGAAARAGSKAPRRWRP